MEQPARHPPPFWPPPFWFEALALFDRGDWFEAHEVLEDLWRVTEGRDREFYQGLIQLAVVLHHLRLGNARGATNVLATCRRHLAPYEPEWRGIDVSKLLEFCNRIEARLALAQIHGHPPTVPDDVPRLTAAKG